MASQEASRTASPSGYNVSQQEGKYWVMILTNSDAELDATLPSNKISLSSAFSLEFKIELVPYTSFSLVSSKVVKIDPDTIVSNDSESRQILGTLYDFAKEWNGLEFLPEYDWSKIRIVDFQSLLREKQEIQLKMIKCVCMKCPDLLKHVLFF